MKELKKEKVPAVKPVEVRERPLPTIEFSHKQIPELADYDAGEEILLKIAGKVTKKVVSDEHNDMMGMNNYCMITVKKVEILNKKENREKAEMMGLDKEDIDEIEEKRKKKKGEVS